MLSEAQRQRYSRHLLLREIGLEGQAALLDACVRIATLNAGGRAAAMWLARAGIGALVIDDDTTPAPALDASGLLFAEDAGQPLSEAVRTRLRFHAPEISFVGESQVVIEVGTTPTEGIEAALGIARRLIEAGRHV